MAERGTQFNLFRVFRTCWEMLRDRGYLVPEDQLNLGFDDFESEYGQGDNIRDSLTIVCSKVNDSQDQIIVFFVNEEKLGAQKMLEYVGRMKEDQIYRGVLILQKKLSGPANSERMLVKNTYRIEDYDERKAVSEYVQFLETELVVNITKHVMVPKHTVLTVEEKQTLLQRYKVKETQLPRIQLSDPVAKYFGMERGEVVRIVRASETAGRYVTYRFCI